MKRLLLFVTLLVPLACAKREAPAPVESTPSEPAVVATIPPRPSPKPTVDPCTLMPHGPGCPTPIPLPTRPRK